jgi:hypothetical protein
MKIVFDDGGRGTAARVCELCLQPMKFLGDHAECRLFTEDVQPHSVLATLRQAALRAL